MNIMAVEQDSELIGWTITDAGATLVLGGRWVLANYIELQAAIERCREALGDRTVVAIDAVHLESLDTVGSQCLVELLDDAAIVLLTETDAALGPERRELLDTVRRAMQGLSAEGPPRPVSGLQRFFGDMGIALTKFWQQFVGLLAFSGMTLQALVLNVFRPRTWRITAIVAQIHETGLNAVPIIALLTFLVGAVVAFLGATILRDFGATSYTVNLVGFSFLREFAVLLTAILMAGRTASAFTAQIGSMKVNEELDALRVQGLSPMELLVLPRVLAMQISLPILTFVGMVSGIVGGMMVCAFSLDIAPARFLDMFVDEVPYRHFVLGMVKAPIFAFLITVIGCLQGFRVGGSAQSVGEHTTSAVVHSIFVVIVLDALAALFYMEMGW